MKKIYNIIEATKIAREIVVLLEAWGYKPEVKKLSDMYTDICCIVKDGFGSMSQRHKDAISMLAKGYLSSFDYESDIQHIYLQNECKGLKPNDDRYSCLIREIIRVNSKDKLYRNGDEVFVNMGDHFKRFVNWKEETVNE